jgi:signal transduction histidine kinase
MGRGSIRWWLLVVSILFALLVVGGIALTTYVIVSDSMQSVAYQTTQRVTRTATAVVRDAVSAAEQTVSRTRLTGVARESAIFRELEVQIPLFFERSGLSGAEFALYAPDGRVFWYSAASGLYPEYVAQRTQAAIDGQSTRSLSRSGGMITGLLSDARLGITVIHAPMNLSAGRVGVLDVSYTPTTEERVIDAIRLPMLGLAVTALLVMVILMQTSMVLVLNLVNNLREAADSIDAGRLEERLPEHGDNEIGELARSFNRLIDRLQRRALAQGRFVADASHELATPVAGIRGYTSILRNWGSEDPKIRDEAIDAIDRESKRMTRLTGDLLNLLHADQALRLKSERFDVNVLARERLATTASRYLEKEIDFEGPESGSVMVLADRGRLEDVLSILLDNAGKYTPEGGVVAVRTERVQEEVSITVSDTGRGIPEADLVRLFDRFYRSDQARADGEAGFGLGLAIAKSIVESMGGSISAESEIGEGTSFTVVIPRGRV